jgi:hypothetical protein
MIFSAAVCIPHQPKHFGQSFGPNALPPPQRLVIFERMQTTESFISFSSQVYSYGAMQ